jgi:hypothetical protein
VVERITNWPHGFVGTHTEYLKVKEEFYRLSAGPRMEKVMSNNEAYKCHFCHKYDDGSAPYRVQARSAAHWEYDAMCVPCRTRLEEDSTWRRTNPHRFLLDGMREAAQQDAARWERVCTYAYHFCFASVLFISGAIVGSFL